LDFYIFRWKESNIPANIFTWTLRVTIRD